MLQIRLNVPKVRLIPLSVKYLGYITSIPANETSYLNLKNICLALSRIFFMLIFSPSSETLQCYASRRQKDEFLGEEIKY
mgnify:CR=1 FL=1